VLGKERVSAVTFGQSKAFDTSRARNYHGPESHMRLVSRALRILLAIAFTYPLWGVAYEIVTGYWSPHWMEFWVDHSRPEPCLFCGGGGPG
jgi:hypothetical protein